MKSNKKMYRGLIAIVLTIAMIFVMAGCAQNQEVASEPTTEVQESVQTAETTEETTQDAAAEETAQTETTVIGEGKTKFLFTVVDKDGNETYFEVCTDKETVGEALQDVNLIEGEESVYGLYVKTVNGTTADYDVDKTYWAFYVDGEYAMSGIDQTTIEEGKTYSLKVEK